MLEVGSAARPAPSPRPRRLARAACVVAEPAPRAGARGRGVGRLDRIALSGPPGPRARAADRPSASATSRRGQVRARCDAPPTFRSGPRAGLLIDFDRPSSSDAARASSAGRRRQCVAAARPTHRDRAPARGALKDLGSANGTDLNGRPVSVPTLLADGDTIAFGAVLAVFQARTRGLDTGGPRPQRAARRDDAWRGGAAIPASADGLR